MNKRALLLLGGTWHPFAAFEQWVAPLLNECGYAVTSTYDMSALLRLDEIGGPDLIVQYTSFGVHERFPEALPGLTMPQAEGLATWVEAGGRLLGVHSATVVGPAGNAVQEALYGARFLEHPPQFSFPVWPTAREHALIAGVGAFTVHDEFYIQAYAEDIIVHMTAVDRGRAYPMVWTRAPGSGRMAYIGMGHSEQVWTLPEYGRLLRNALGWLEQG